MSPIATEVDRQLSEQRATSDAYTQRSGVLIATCTLLAAVPQVTAIQVSEWFILTIGISIIAGVVALGTSQISRGPSPAQMGHLRGPAGDVEHQLTTAKILALESNDAALVRCVSALWVQQSATALAVVALLHAMWG